MDVRVHKILKNVQVTCHIGYCVLFNNLVQYRRNLSKGLTYLGHVILWIATCTLISAPITAPLIIISGGLCI